MAAEKSKQTERDVQGGTEGSPADGQVALELAFLVQGQLFQSGHENILRFL